MTTTRRSFLRKVAATAAALFLPAKALQASTRSTLAMPKLLRQAPPGCVDIRSFGAKCDGITDDTAAVLRAADSRCNLYFPGVTRVTSPLRLRDRHLVVGGTVEIDDSAEVRLEGCLVEPAPELIGPEGLFPGAGITNGHGPALIRIVTRRAGALPDLTLGAPGTRMGQVREIGHFLPTVCIQDTLSSVDLILG